jgi:uncharacterized membrane protein HdeD (DUF308 family)
VVVSEIRSAAGAVGQRLTDRIGRFWWVLLTRGIAAVLFGIAALIWPQKSLALLVFLVGGYLVLDGLSGLLLALRSGDLGASLLQGLASAVGGAAVLFWPGITTSLLLVILGIWAIVQGVGLFLAGRGLRDEGEDGSLLLTAGAILAVFGVVALVWRDVGAVALSWLVALVALAVGGLLILVATRVKNTQERLQSARLPGA